MYRYNIHMYSAVCWLVQLFFRHIYIITPHVHQKGLNTGEYCISCSILCTISADFHSVEIVMFLVHI